MCDYQATLKFNLSRHVKNVHQKSENITCSECNKSIQKEYLKRHMRMFHSGEQTLFNCKVCTYQSIHQYAVNSHVRNVHQKLQKINDTLHLHGLSSLLSEYYAVIDRNDSLGVREIHLAPTYSKFIPHKKFALLDSSHSWHTD